MGFRVRKLMARKFPGIHFLATNFLTFSGLGSLDFLWHQESESLLPWAFRIRCAVSGGGCFSRSDDSDDADGSVVLSLRLLL
jgi:hypothetical protein